MIVEKNNVFLGILCGVSFVIDLGVLLFFVRE